MKGLASVLFWQVVNRKQGGGRERERGKEGVSEHS